MAVYYHGSSVLFDSFDLSHALFDDGATWSDGNLMGRLLMELRDTDKLDYTLPEDAIRFRDLLEP